MSTNKALSEVDFQDVTCETNSQVLQSDQFKDGLYSIFSILFPPEKVHQRIKLIMRLVNDENLENEDLDIINALLNTKGLIIRGEEYISKNRNLIDYDSLRENNIKPANILRILVTKLISQKVRNILGDEINNSDQKFNFNTNKDLFGEIKAECDIFIIFKLGNKSFFLNKLTKKFKKYKNIEPIENVIGTQEIGSIQVEGKFVKVKPIPIYGKSYFETQNEEGLYGVIDKEGKEIIKCKYKKIEFDNAYGFKVQNNLFNYGILDTDGKEIIQCKYKEIKFNKVFGYQLINDEGLIGVTNIEGIEVFECKYNELIGFVPDIGFLLDLNNSLGVLNPQGKEIEQFINDSNKIRIKKIKMQGIEKEEIQKFTKLARRNILDTSTGFEKFYRKILNILKLLFSSEKS